MADWEKIIDSIFKKFDQLDERLSRMEAQVTVMKINIDWLIDDNLKHNDIDTEERTPLSSKSESNEDSSEDDSDYALDIFAAADAKSIHVNSTKQSET
ncbi:hypothetical protein LOK49_LG08G01726 [Camellia lanceoleosa]|uniref:Uncharacterized protein n=1 Tax=Camellia lanceoleosa TaxID=1840588 RepID=A0ACC0GV29_9ERIC|nr:hypothetical protein LOK49_LG08G01726 [Camellia lanceoleosa]